MTPTSSIPQEGRIAPFDMVPATTVAAVNGSRAMLSDVSDMAQYLRDLALVADDADFFSRMGEVASRRIYGTA